MADMSTFLENACLNFYFNGIGYTKPTIWTSWGSAPPDESGTPSGEETAVARLNTITWPDATGGAAATTTNNNADVDFDTTGSGWSNQSITHALYWDAVTGGNLLAWTTLGTPLSVNDGEPIRVVASALTIDFPDDLTGSPTNVHLSDYLRETWLSHVFGVASIVAPAVMNCRLHDGDPSNTGTALEFSGGGYVPQVIDFGTPAPGPSGNFQMVQNTAQLTWVNLANTLIAQWTVHETSPGINFLARNDQVDSVVQVGDNATVAANTLTVAVD